MEPSKRQDSAATSEQTRSARENALSELIESRERARVLQESLDACYQCGACSGGCPVARIVPEYHIRRIVKNAREGKLDINDKILWFCSTCYLCYERCPQDVKPIHLMHEITNLVSKKGCAPTPVKEGNRGILNTGRIVEVSALTQQKRKQLGLPELKPNVSKDFKLIAKLTGMERMSK